MSTKLVASLEACLGTAFCLYTKAHAFHWNVTGASFPQLHEMFGRLYADLHTAVDDIAEHIRALDSFPPSGTIWETPISLLVMSESRKLGSAAGRLFAPSLTRGSSRAAAGLILLCAMAASYRMALRRGLLERAKDSSSESLMGPSDRAG